MKRKLEIDWMELDGAFQTGSWEMGYISQTRRAKSVSLTEEGILRAQEIEERYTF